MPNVFLMGRDEIIALERLRAHAETHERTPEDRLGPPGDDPDHVVEIPVGYRVVFTVEQAQVRVNNDRVWVRRVSISAATPGRVPSPEVCELIMRPLGFVGGLARCKVDLEEFAPGHRAVGAAQLIEFAVHSIQSGSGENPHPDGS